MIDTTNFEIIIRATKKKNYLKSLRKLGYFNRTRFDLTFNCWSDGRNDRLDTGWSPIGNIQQISQEMNAATYRHTPDSNVPVPKDVTSFS